MVKKNIMVRKQDGSFRRGWNYDGKSQAILNINISLHHWETRPRACPGVHHSHPASSLHYWRQNPFPALAPGPQGLVPVDLREAASKLDV